MSMAGCQPVAPWLSQAQASGLWRQIPLAARNKHPRCTERARRLQRSCEIPIFTQFPDLLGAVKYDQQSSVCREQIGHQEKKSELELGSNVFKKSGFFFRLEVR